MKSTNKTNNRAVELFVFLSRCLGGVYFDYS